MTMEQSRQYTASAKREREAGNYVTAGDYYSQAAFEAAGHGTFLHPSSGVELRRLLEACTCYRIEEADRWATSRAEMGEVFAEELVTRAFAGAEETHAFDQAMRGVWYEFVGDFRIVGELGGADTAYEQAKETYLAADDPLTSALEPPQSALMSYFYSVADAAGADMDEVYEVTKEQPFSEVAEYKQEHLPSLLRQVVANGSYSLENSQ